MLSRHLAYAHIGANDDHRIVWHETDKTKHRRLEILLVTTQVEEGDKALRILCYMGPRLVLVGIHMLHLDLGIILIETHDFLSDTRGSTIGRFVAKVENLLTSRASSIISDTLGHHTDHCAFTRVYVANDGNTDIIRVTAINMAILNLIEHGILELRGGLDISDFRRLNFIENSNICWR